MLRLRTSGHAGFLQGMAKNNKCDAGLPLGMLHGNRVCQTSLNLNETKVSEMAGQIDLFFTIFKHCQILGQVCNLVNL